MAANPQPPNDRLLITVHGIRTFGSWQDRLGSMLRDEHPGTETLHYRYGYFSAVAFLIPFVRDLVVRRFARGLNAYCKGRTWERVDIVAHSFGTYIVANALLRTRLNEGLRVNSVIFAGSVLKSNFPIERLIGERVKRVVNECGIRDSVLVLSQVASIGTGMAGRSGIVGFQSATFQNRFYDFGHGGYFEDDGSFMRREWLPLLTSEEQISPRLYPRPISGAKGAMLFLINNADVLKVMLWMSLPVFLALYFFLLRNKAETAQRQAEAATHNAHVAETKAEVARGDAEAQAALANSGRLAAVSALNRVNNVDLAALLSLEAQRAADTFEARNSMLRSLQANPGLVAILDRSQTRWRQVALNPKTGALVGGNEDGTITFWNMTTRRRMGRPLVGYIGPVVGLAISPNGKTLATGGLVNGQGDWAVRLWDFDSRRPLGDPIYVRGPSGVIYSIAFSPDGKILAFAGFNQLVWLWDIDAQRSLGNPIEPQSGAVLSIAFSHNGEVLASASANGQVQLWSLASHKQLGDPMKGEEFPQTVAFSPDDKLLASGGWNSSVRLWDLATHRQVGQPSDTNAVISLAFSPTGDTLEATGMDGIVRLWQVSTDGLGKVDLENTADFIGHFGEASGSVFTLDGKTIASAGSDGTVRLWDVEHHQAPFGQLLPSQGDGVFSVVFSPDGKILASAGSDGTLRLWDVVARQPRGALFGRSLGPPDSSSIREVSGIAFGPDAKLLVSLDRDKARLWNALTRRPLSGDFGTARSLALSPDGRQVALGGYDGDVRISDLVRRVPLAKPLCCHSDQVESVAFSADGKMLASVGRQGDLRLWNATQHLSEGKPLLCKNDAAFAVAFSPDSKTVAVGYSGGTVRVWDVLSHQQIGEPLKGDFSSDIKSVAFSHDGSLLAAASSDGRGVQLWDMSKRLPFGDPLDGGSDNEATSVAFSPDDKLLAVANSDGTTWLWDLERDSWASMLCSLANRNLSDGEWKQFFGAKVTYRRTCRNLPPGESEVMGQQGSKN